MTRRTSTKDIDLGFGIYSDPSTDTSYNTKVIILAPQSVPPPELRKLCTKCNGSVTWINQVHRFICYACGISYPEHFTTLPNEHSNANHIQPLQSIDPYHSVEPAIVSKKLDRSLEGEPKNKHVQITGNLRRATIKTDHLGMVLSEDDIKAYFMGEGRIE